MAVSQKIDKWNATPTDSLSVAKRYENMTVTAAAVAAVSTQWWGIEMSLQLVTVDTYEWCLLQS